MPIKRKTSCSHQELTFRLEINSFFLLHLLKFDLEGVWGQPNQVREYLEISETSHWSWTGPTPQEAMKWCLPSFHHFYAHSFIFIFPLSSSSWRQRERKDRIRVLGTGLERELETVNFLCPFSLSKGLLFDTCHWGQYTSPRLTPSL